MDKTYEFTTLNGDTGELSAGEWSRDDAIEWSFMEADAKAEAEAQERKLDWCREIIEKFHQERSNKNDQ